jgi:hypothetical protein
MRNHFDVSVLGATNNPVKEMEKLKADLAIAHVAIATARFRLERIGRRSLWFANFTDAELTDAQAARATLAGVELDHRLLAGWN